eukprot:NODE_72_length_24857_cov_0.454399.p7 type:complete len:299 gc:universal NODE_72_length_24857_cov_0.454399:9683-10579(+)
MFLLCQWIATVSLDCPKLIPFAQQLNIHIINTTIWNQINLDCCLAPGIKCGNNKVIVINWSGMNLNGTLNGNLSGLSALFNLDVSNNLINGTISTLLPSNLNALHVDGNYLNGTLTNWTLPLNLQTLNINSNQFTGSLPSGISQLTQLTANYNLFTGVIPYLSPSLNTLTVGNNLLTGFVNIPPFLKQLFLGRNLLTGDLPIMPDSLNIIFLGGNQFTGTISAYKPQYLWISDNLFTGLNITDYSAILPGQCSLNNNPLLGASNLPPLGVCYEIGLYSLQTTQLSGILNSFSCHSLGE